MKQIYLDNQSCTRVSDEVLEEMLPYLKEFYGNPQSMYSLGSMSKDAIENARNKVAALIGASASEMYFTSCASEANNLAIKGVSAAMEKKGKHIIVSSIEHFSILNSVKRLAQAGFEVTYVPVDKDGLVSPEDVRSVIRDDTALVSIQHANPEIGTVQPIKEIAQIVHEKGALFHTDAVASAGMINTRIEELGVDLLTFSSAQMHGPKGAAALYIRKGTRITPQIEGGVQENGKRAGTENVAGIVGFGKAAEAAAAGMDKNYLKINRLRDKIINSLPEKIQYVYLNGHPQRRLPNNVNFSVEFIEGESMFLMLDQKGIMVASGSACASKSLRMSHVLSSLNIDPAVAQGSIVITLSKYNTEDEINILLKEFPKIVEKLRGMSPLYDFFLKTGKRHAAGPGTDYEHEHEHEEQQ
jgi:cysteine desulfurase